MPQDVENIRKQLLWRATRRGIKEMDILVGGYAKANLHVMGPLALAQFADLLEIPDQDLLAWATGVEQVPAKFSCSLLTEVLAFRPEAQ